MTDISKVYDSLIIISSKLGSIEENVTNTNDKIDKIDDALKLCGDKHK